MRPKNISQIVGQQHLVGKNKIIYRMVKSKTLSSMILYGPPGTGKTSIASAIAGTTKYAFRILNAATDTKKDLQAIAEESKMSGTVILLLDEIHRLDKTKQDFLLPLMESGKIILIGATTENPYISINPAIRSRASIFEVFSLKPNDISEAIKRAIKDKTNGLGQYNVNISENAIKFLSEGTNGDLRNALNTLEIIVMSGLSEKKVVNISLADVEDCLQKKPIAGDKNGDSHYNVISAFQKSIRGSDVNAALHYAARLICSGDLQSLCRRLMVIAYEDIGLANPSACNRTIQAIDAANQLGLPEGRIPIADAIIELCLSPKSNSGMLAIDKAIERVEQNNYGNIPSYLKDNHYYDAKKMGVGKDYKYPHNYPNDWVKQQYLPDKIKDDCYYIPKNNGKFETAFEQQYNKLLKAQNFNNNS
ncbi:replication-associated recombination protein A [Apilactobacillus ozensis]|uniref:replication-associated recombination protein A n=1 Tax=Apilactobacillus ozensis TaxID=866801 RepID=UPI00200B96F3|nr:replication-associated recombination protein A [Apilactobacillus ozensis]MCK8606941.1 replication-associated recombination protein A [Apilactobacillus ozensis]